jgi:hypothetical protein
MREQSAVMRPLRRAAGERKGPVAKQRVGEVVLLSAEIFAGASDAPTSPSPRYARVPSLSPHYVGGEGL